MKKPKLLLLAMLILACIFVKGQTTLLQLVSTSGESFKNTNYQLDWSIGEILTETHASPQNSLTQGFHQGKYIITAFDQINDLRFEISAYPNPATDFVTLTINSDKVERSQFKLSDINGKELQTGRLTGNRQQIDLSGIAAGSYFIKVIFNNASIKTFKIIKSY